MICGLLTIMVFTAFSYSPRVSENDSTPWLTACGTRPFIGSVAISQDLFRTPGFNCGDIIRVYVDRTTRSYVINDTMHPRHRMTIDIWDPSMSSAIRFGKKTALVCRTQNNTHPEGGKQK